MFLRGWWGSGLLVSLSAACASATLTTGDPGAPTPRERDAARARLAHNVIVFMGDGMGPEQLATGRVARGSALRIDELAGPALAITDSLTTLRLGPDTLTATDSAASATWIATGEQVDNDVISQGAHGEPLESVLERCQQAGKATGLVTTSNFFDASPAAFGAHQASRTLYEAIAEQLLTETQPDVLMGNDTWLLPDDRAHIHELAATSGYTIVRDHAALTAWDPIAEPRLLGLFDTHFLPLALGGELFTMTPALERTEDSSDPTLAQMTARALARLAQDPEGFFLFVEDETFDQIGHRGPLEVTWANRALPAQVAGFDAAVSVALDWVAEHSSFDDTLVVVLADHETGGYHFDHTLGPESGDFSAYVGGTTGVHTRTPIAVYARGPGSDAIDRVASLGDAHRLLRGSLQP
ncbi:MAG: alkaline phosphatase [Polyangiales bacterium]